MKEEKLCPRFVYEYANYQKRWYKSAFRSKDAYEKTVKTIDYAVSMREIGKITITEAMELIAYPYNTTIAEINDRLVDLGIEKIEYPA